MRRSSREVRIGGIVIGGSREPVVQSMTSTLTTDVDATLSQAIRLHELGARLVRLAVPDNRSLRALASLKQKMAIRDIAFPIIADIHFSLKLALDALREVAKLRVNPGNLLDIPRGRAGNGRATQIDQRTREQALKQLLSAAKVAGKAVRIGVNQGSLSKRIVERYGNGPEAMVESAMEYITMARENAFFDLVISLKSSDPWSIVAAHSLLARRGVEFPFHVGVTEAGWGLQGRARSAAGIGSLLRRGLVDTLRVSLAEPPEKELPVAKALIEASRPIVVVDSSRKRGKVHGAQVVCSEGDSVVGEVRTRIVSAAGSFVSDPNNPGGLFRVVDLCDHYQDVPDEVFIARVVGNPDSPSELSRWIKDRILSRGLEKKVMAVQLPLPGWEAGGEESLTSVLEDLRTALIWEIGFSDETELMLAVSDLAQLFEAGFLDVLELRTGDGPDADRPGLCAFRDIDWRTFRCRDIV